MTQNIERPYTKDDVQKNHLLWSIARRYLLSKPRAHRNSRRFNDIKRAYLNSWGSDITADAAAFVLNRMVLDPEQSYKIPEPGTVRNRREAFAAMNALVHVPFARAGTGRLIHRVAEDGFHYTLWMAPHEVVYDMSVPAESGQAVFLDLNVKLKCKYPSWIKNPVLLNAEEAEEALAEDPDLAHCPHCAKVAEED